MRLQLFTAKYFSSWAQSLTAQSSSCLVQRSERTTSVLFLKITLLAFTILEKVLQTGTKNKTKTVLLQNTARIQDQERQMPSKTERNVNFEIYRCAFQWRGRAGHSGVQLQPSAGAACSSCDPANVHPTG